MKQETSLIRMNVRDFKCNQEILNAMNKE